MPQQKLDLDALLAAGVSSKPVKHPTPRRSRWKWHTALLGALFLAAGFAAGFFAYDPPYTDPAVTPPAETLILQPNYSISTQQLISATDELACYLYTKKPSYILSSPSIYSSTLFYSLTDEHGTYVLGNWPLDIPPDACNFFLRVEFTEEGINRLDTESFRISVNGRPPENNDDPYLHMGIAHFRDGNGFFVVGYLSQSAKIDLKYRDPDSGQPVHVVFNASLIHPHISGETRALIELALAGDTQVWTQNNGGLPETFEKDTLFARILEKEDCIDWLLEYAASLDPTERARSQALLNHPAFQSKMHEVQRSILNDLKKNATCILYETMVDIVNRTPSPSGAPVGPSYFDAPDGVWTLGSAQQTVLGETPQEYNFFARVELSEFVIGQCDPAWYVRVSKAADSPDAALCAQTYIINYDGSSQTAGWLLYGYIEAPVDLQIQICDGNGECLYSTELHAIPAVQFVFTPTS